MSGLMDITIVMVVGQMDIGEQVLITPTRIITALGAIPILTLMKKAIIINLVACTVLAVNKLTVFNNIYLIKGGFPPFFIC